MMHPEYTGSSSGARKHAQLRLGIGVVLVTLLGCGDGDGVTISTPKGDCVAPDQTVVRQNVTQAQCTEICPTCSWAGGEHQ